MTRFYNSIISFIIFSIAQGSHYLDGYLTSKTSIKWILTMGNSEQRPPYSYFIYYIMKVTNTYW